MNGHTPTSQLALYSRGDLGFWNRRRLERHLERCEECAGRISEFTRIQEELAHAAQVLPPGLNGAAWQSLASEMRANIRLGISAGECVSMRPLLTGRPRWTLALAGLAVLLVLAVLEHPRLGNPPYGIMQADDGLQTLEASANGIAVHGGGHMLAVPAPAGRNVIRTVNTRGEMRSRYVDDTGVTITDVYASAE